MHLLLTCILFVRWALTLLFASVEECYFNVTHMRVIVAGHKLESRDIVDGHRQKTLQLLWTLIFNFKVTTWWSIFLFYNNVYLLHMTSNFFYTDRVERNGSSLSFWRMVYIIVISMSIVNAGGYVTEWSWAGGWDLVSEEMFDQSSTSNYLSEYRCSSRYLLSNWRCQFVLWQLVRVMVQLTWQLFNRNP